MKDGNLFVLVSKSSEVFDVANNKTKKRLPDIKGLYRTYPNTGGSVMLPLSSADKHEPTFMICGGGGWQGIDSPGEASCGLISPLSRNPKWAYTWMPEGRCMVEGILLLDGTVLWINGAQKGAEGFGIADKPAFEALIYNPADCSWTEAGRSKIPRLYHSVALMLLDGSVLVAGSNPNEMPILLHDIDTNDQYRKYPTEFRIERWTPPYLQDKTPGDRPMEIEINQKVLKADGMSFKVVFRSQKKVDRVKVVLYQGGFVTHALHMGQVMVELDHHRHHHRTEKARDGRQEVTVTMPKIALAPGPYVIYVLVNGVPGMGQFVSLET